jgi:hypothetical protein
MFSVSLGSRYLLTFLLMPNASLLTAFRVKKSAEENRPDAARRVRAQFGPT